MDALRLAPAAPPPEAYLPPEAPLAMPVQSLRDGARAPVRFAPPAVAARRAFVFGTAGLLSIVAAYEMYLVLAVGGLTALEAVVLVLFVILFVWVALSFASMLGGVIAMATRRAQSIDIDTGTPLPAMLVALTLTMMLPVTPAGMKTLSTLLRRSAAPPVTESAPENTLPL